MIHIQYYIIFVGTLFALFWDEMLIAMIGMMFNKSFSLKFIILWIIISGVLVGLFLILQIPSEYHTLVMVIIALSIGFSISQHQQKHKE